MQRKSFRTMSCPIARSLERVGEWWSMLILRDVLHGLRRFDEFQESLGIAPNMLARLKESGIPVNNYLRQGALFGRETTPTQDKLLSAFDGISRSRKSIREMLERYADKIISSPDPRQAGMFGAEELTEEDILFAILQGAE